MRTAREMLLDALRALVLVAGAALIGAMAAWGFR